MDDTRKDIHTVGVPVLCQSCEARHRGICGGMKENELLALGQTTKIKTFPAGSTLTSEEQAPDTYGNILSGVVKLSKLMSDGRQQIVGLQFAPDFLGRPFGESSRVTAEAATDVAVCVFPRNALHDMMAESPGLEARMHKQALNELDEAREWMLTLGRRTALEKVASFLVQIALHADPAKTPPPLKPATITVPLSRADIADFLGLTIETVSRQFGKLRETGVIENVSGRRVTIPSLSKLRALAGS